MCEPGKPCHGEEEDVPSIDVSLSVKTANTIINILSSAREAIAADEGTTKEQVTDAAAKMLKLVEEALKEFTLQATGSAMEKLFLAALAQKSKADVSVMQSNKALI